MKRSRGIVVTCEHATDRVPPELTAEFRSARRALASHRGIDFGAWLLAQDLSRPLGAPLVAGEVSRLVVDVNRNLGHPELFSEWSSALGEWTQSALLERYWRPYREAVWKALEAEQRIGGPVLHLAVHTFTPRWNGHVRDADVALLYDPRRTAERAFVTRWLTLLHRTAPELRLRRNYPYRGTDDGLTAALREALDETDYLGLELEVSQRFPCGPAERWDALRRVLRQTLLEALDVPDSGGSALSYSGWLPARDGRIRLR